MDAKEKQAFFELCFGMGAASGLWVGAAVQDPWSAVIVGFLCVGAGIYRARKYLRWNRD